MIIRPVRLRWESLIFTVGLNDDKTSEIEMFFSPLNIAITCGDMQELSRRKSLIFTVGLNDDNTS
jgi:hypothetical protein